MDDKEKKNLDTPEEKTEDKPTEDDKSVEGKDSDIKGTPESDAADSDESKVSESDDSDVVDSDDSGTEESGDAASDSETDSETEAEANSKADDSDAKESDDSSDDSDASSEKKAGKDVKDKSAKDEPALLNSETAGDELRNIFSSAGKGISWIFPQHLSWVVLWLCTMAFVYLGQNSLMLYADRLLAEADPMLGIEAIPPFLVHMDLSLIALQTLLFVLPLILLTIHGGVTRGIKVYTDKEILPPKPVARYLIAIVIASIHAIIAYAIAVVIYVLDRNFQMESFSVFIEEFWLFAGTLLILGLFVPLLFASLWTAIFSAWAIGSNVQKHEEGKEIRPARAALAAMLIFLLSFAVVTYSMAGPWQAQQERMWEQEQEMGGAELDFDWDDENFLDELGEEFFLDESMMDDFDWDDEGSEDIPFEDEPIYLDDLLGEEDYGEVTIDNENP
ncbi:MAG: hypothetical protein FWC86_01400 [Coriobacteriia bacterium]|nr:hypothetical protein [Coriobacteriia bacterium]